MQKGLLIKFGLVALIFILLQIPLNMIKGIVAERAARQQSVVDEIAKSSYGSQVFSGLMLSIPYIEEYDEAVEGSEGKVARRTVVRTVYVFPTKSESKGEVNVSSKSRGLFKARVYDWSTSLNGNFSFEMTGLVASAHEGSRIIWGEPFVSLAVSDSRGLDGALALQWNGAVIPLERGSGLIWLPNGLHAKIPGLDPTKPQSFEYTMKLKLRGTESLAFLPLATENNIYLKSQWPHPSFGGHFLPQTESQVINKDGFDAHWSINGAATNAPQQMIALLSNGKVGATTNNVESVGIRFVNPIDIYSLTDRALKYGFLFIALTFVCLILIELLKQLRIHPAQYLLGGLALGVFFLLLIALSEHVEFWVAYLVASLACISLLGYYLTAVLRSVGRGLMFSAMLTTLYGALYGLLISEDNALLLGALLVFGILAVTMAITRRLDWYALKTPELAKQT